MRTTFRTDVTFKADVTVVTEPREGKPPEVIAIERVQTVETGHDLLEALSITDRVALAQEAEVAAELDAGADL